MNRNCFDGYLTEECKNCEFWADGSDMKKGIGCMYPGPIDNCEAFAKAYEEEEERIRREQCTKK